MDNEILQQILSELKDLKQGQASLEKGQAETNKRLDRIEEDIADIKESLEEVRSTTNILADWANRTEVVVKVPLLAKVE